MNLNYYQDYGVPRTERLHSRNIKPEDASEWEPFFNDRDSLQFLPVNPQQTLAEYSEFWIERQLQRYQNRQFGLKAIIRNADQVLVGMCGLLLQEVDHIQEVEVGYHILPAFRKLGYATEAANGFMQFAFDNNLCDSLISIIDVRNEKSLNVAGKNGLMLDKTTQWKELKVHIYRIYPKHFFRDK